MKTALTCIAKDELYIDEWVRYHHKLGFDHIFIYENDWESNIDLPYVTKIKFPGKIIQLNAYNNFLSNYKDEFDYVAFIDVDEFIVLKKHKTFNDFMNDYQHQFGIGINWQYYGSTGEETFGGNTILDKYTLRQSDVNHHIKSILNMKSGLKMMSPHFCNQYVVDTNGNKIKGPFNENGSDDVIILNHYYRKTLVDWTLKSKRGQPDSNYHLTKDIWMKYDKLHLEVEDLTAYNFLYNQTEFNCL